MTIDNNSKIYSKEPLIRLKNIYKNFGHIVALENVDLDVYQKEILGIVGDNGAGKSTLIKIISGFITADSGEIYYKGELVKITSPRDAQQLGIGTVYQDLALIDCLNVASNVFLGREPTRAGIFVNKKKLNEQTMETLKRIKIDLKAPNMIVGFLSGGQRQSIAIARAISMESYVYILDEPTAALGVKESEQVFKIIKELKAHGHTIIIISHNLEHVFSLVDRIFVLRQGKKVGSRFINKTSKEEIISMITTGTHINK